MDVLRRLGKDIPDLAPSLCHIIASGMFNGLPAYACALLLLAAGLVLSVLYAVTVGSAELSVGEVYRVILYELFRWGDPEQLGSGAVHDIVWLIRLPRRLAARRHRPVQA